MFSAVLIGPAGLAAGAIEQFALDSGEVHLYKTLHTPPSAYDVKHMAAAYDPDIMFVGAGAQSVETVIQLFRECAPRVALIGFDTGEGGTGEGWDGWIPPRCTQSGFDAVIRKAIHTRSASSVESLLVFLPAKAGSGSSTTVLNIGGALAELKKRVLVIEADMHSGVFAILLKLEPLGSLQAALDKAAELDYSRWTGMVTPAHGMDLLLRVGPQASLISWSQYYHLLHFAAQQYDHILMDLPEVTNDATMEAVRQARGVLVVCTPELPSLALAKQRCTDLLRKGVQEKRLALVVNRRHRRDLRSAEIEEFVGFRVAAELPNDYPSVHQSILNCTLVTRTTQLGQAYSDFAARLTKTEALPSRPARPGLLATLKNRFSSHTPDQE